AVSACLRAFSVRTSASNQVRFSAGSAARSRMVSIKHARLASSYTKTKRSSPLIKARTLNSLAKHHLPRRFVPDECRLSVSISSAALGRLAAQRGKLHTERKIIIDNIRLACPGWCGELPGMDGGVSGSKMGE